MSKFREKELSENLKKFERKTKVELGFERGLEGNMILEEATVTYDEEYGFIYIKSKEAEFKINTTLVDNYEKNNTEISIYVESIVLKIRNLS